MQKLSGAIALLSLLLLTVLLLVPVKIGGPDGRGAQARQDVMALVVALRAYRTEYGSFPLVSERAEHEPRKMNAELLKALLGSDPTQNPRRIIFFEANTARKKRGTFSRGLDPVDLAFLDPWGNPYRVRLRAPGAAGGVSPYNDNSNPPHDREVLAWSLGPDGKQGTADDPAVFKGSDDIVSWQY